MSRKKLILLILGFLFILTATTITPLAWIGILIYIFGVYQIYQQSKGKAIFPKPFLIVITGFIISSLLAMAFVEPPKESTKLDDVKKDAIENKKEKQDKEEQIAKEQTKQEVETKEKEQTKQESEKKEQATASSLGLIAATVSRVVDGDTVELSDGSKVRLVGVNTPESTIRHEQYGKEASNYTKSKLEGKKVWLQKDVSETDRYNRLLRIVWLAIPTDTKNEQEIRTKMFNADLVINGYAEPSTYPPDVTYSEYFVKFAREARTNGTGLWAYGENGTTKGDLDPKEVTTNKTSQTTNDANTTNTNNPNNNNNTATTPPSQSNGSESYANCTELRKVYPNGVPSSHPAYAPKLDRDKDGYACER